MTKKYSSNTNLSTTETPIPGTSHTLVDLCHHRWIIPALAVIQAERGGTRLAVLRGRLGASRDALRTAVDTAMEIGLVARNPGYGHPLRPEFILTTSGRGIARCCADYVSAVVEAGVEPIGFRKWTAPLLQTIGEGNERFGAIQNTLAGITPRALTTSLKALCDARLLSREVDDGYPPRSTYHLGPLGERLARPAAEMAALLGAS